VGKSLEGFMNIWEIEQHFKCPVVGAMLSVDKHRTILKKSGWDVNRLKPYEYHSHLMGCMGDKNTVSVKVNNFIRHQARKFMTEIAGLFDKGDGAKVRTMWEKYSAQGEIGPVMYAIVSHEDADIELLQDIHGEVHMLAHANMTEVFEVRKKLDIVEKSLARERMKRIEKNAAVREFENRAKQMGVENDAVLAENILLKKRIRTLELNDEDRAAFAYAEKIKRLEQELAAADVEIRERDRKIKQLQIQLFSIQNENEMIKKEIDGIVTSFAGDPSAGDDMPECPVSGNCPGDSCPKYRLCAKRIFMIGGITKMKAYYRDIVEKAGGKFDYHDGYMKNSNTNLAAMVKRCDVVVCPVNCNSHNACLKVKKLCGRYDKELKILNSASLSAVTQALMEPESVSAN